MSVLSCVVIIKYPQLPTNTVSNPALSEVILHPLRGASKATRQTLVDPKRQCQYRKKASFK